MRGRLILARHGESVGNATRTFTDSPEVTLTDLGRAQARRSAEILKERFSPVHLISSPYRRARDTAEIISSVLDLAIEVEPAVREQSYGELRGQPYEVARTSPGFAEIPRWDWRPPGGETLREVRARSAPALGRVARTYPDEHAVIVCHGGTIWALWSHVVDDWERAGPIGNAELLVIAHDGERFTEPEVVPLEPA
jgi:probable phosphoglycerate mutase